jgi:transposase
VRHIELTDAERSRLGRLLRAAPNARVYRRTLLLLELDSGKTIAEVARTLRISRDAAYRWLDVYTATRDPLTLGDRPRSGRPPFWSADASEVLRTALDRSPDQWGYKAVNWTVPLLRRHIEREVGSKPSDTTVRRRLHHLDYSWKRSRHVLPDSKTPRAVRRQRLIRRKVKDLPPGCAKLFEDETEIHLFPPLRAGWAPRGKEANVLISGENSQRAIFGAIDIETGRRILLGRKALCASDFQVVLRLIRQSYGDRKVALILDGASCHTAGESRSLARRLDITLIWLPPRSPQLNPVDRLWNCAKQHVCANRQYSSIEEQERLFIEYLHNLDGDEALRKAGLRANNFWLFHERAGRMQGRTEGS